VTLFIDEWRQSEVGGERRRRISILLTPRSWRTSAVLKQLLRIRIDAIRHEDTEADQTAKEVLDLLEVWQQSNSPTGKRILRSASEIRRQVEEMRRIVDSVPSMSIPELIRNLNQQTYVAGHVATEIGKRGVKEGVAPLVEALYRVRISKNVEPIVHA